MANEFAYYNCDRYENPDRKYHGNMKVFENKIFNCVEDADAFIERYGDSGYYRDCAVRQPSYKKAGKFKAANNEAAGGENGL